MPNRREEDTRQGVKTGHSHIPRKRGESAQGFQHENGLDTSQNGKNSKSISDNIPSPKQQKGVGFETFVMTGDMIIRTTKKNEPSRKSYPPEKIPKKAMGSLKEPSMKVHTDSSKTKAEGSPAKAQGTGAKTQGSPSKTVGSPVKCKVASPSKIPSSPSKAKKAESKIPMPSKSRIPKPASQKESPKHSVKDSPKPSRTPLSVRPSNEQTNIGASLASPESTDLEDLELVNNNVILNVAKNSEPEGNIEGSDTSETGKRIDDKPALAMQDADDLVMVDRFPTFEDNINPPLTISSNNDMLIDLTHPGRLESPMSPGEPVFDLELDLPSKDADLDRQGKSDDNLTSGVEEEIAVAMAEPPLEACAAGGTYLHGDPHSFPGKPLGYMSFAGYRFPDVDLALDIPPDDISSEDDNYRNSDSLVDVDDLPPPPDELLQDLNVKPDPTPPLSPYPASAIFLREEFSIGAAQGYRSSPNDQHNGHGGFKPTFEPSTLETVMESEITTSRLTSTSSRDFSPAISVPGASGSHSGSTGDKRCPAPMGIGVRTSRSQEDYFRNSGDGMSLMDIDFDESMAASVDVLPYGYRDKTCTSLDTVSMPGCATFHDDPAIPHEMSRSLDNSPERGYVERTQMPTFISLDDPRGKKGRGRQVSTDSDTDYDDPSSSLEITSEQLGQMVAPTGVARASHTGSTTKGGQSHAEVKGAVVEGGSGSSNVHKNVELYSGEGKHVGTSPLDIIEDCSGDHDTQEAPSDSPTTDSGFKISGVTQTSSDTEGMGPSVASKKQTPSPNASPVRGIGFGIGAGKKGVIDKGLAPPANNASNAKTKTSPLSSPSKIPTSPHHKRSPPFKKSQPQKESSPLPQNGDLLPSNQLQNEDAVNYLENKGPQRRLDGGALDNEGGCAGNSEARSPEAPTVEIEPSEVMMASSSSSSSSDGGGPPSQEGGGESDADSVYHQPIKDVDRPSAARLAKRLFHNDGFKRQDISRHLHKKNDFAQLVGEEYLKFFDFTSNTLEQSLRRFLKHLTLAGETQERERVLAHFSKRFMECNPASFKSEDACHTLTCALMLLNTDLHGQNIGRKMTLGEFIENLADLNDGENFPKETLKQLYSAIKVEPLECEIEEEVEDLEALAMAGGRPQGGAPIQQQSFIGHNPFLDVPDPSKAVEYKKGYVMRKCCVDADGRRTPMGKRGWKMFYVVLRDMIMYLHKDEPSMKKSSPSSYESSANAIRIHHSLATKAADYTKKQHVLRLNLPDGAQFLFQTSDSNECQEWIDTVNFVAASFSAPPLPGAVGSQKKFQRPLMPSSYTKLNLREQLLEHEKQIQQRDQELHDHQLYPPEKGAKSRIISDYVEKEHFLQFELKRFKTYLFLLQAKLASFPELEPSLVEVAIGEVEEPLPSPESSRASPRQNTQQSPVSDGQAIPDQRRDERSKPVQRSMSDRYSYRAAIYNKDEELENTEDL